MFGKKLLLDHEVLSMCSYSVRCVPMTVNIWPLAAPFVGRESIHALIYNILGDEQ